GRPAADAGGGARADGQPLADPAGRAHRGPGAGHRRPARRHLQPRGRPGHGAAADRTEHEPRRARGAPLLRHGQGRRRRAGRGAEQPREPAPARGPRDGLSLLPRFSLPFFFPPSAAGPPPASHPSSPKETAMLNRKQFSEVALAAALALGMGLPAAAWAQAKEPVKIGLVSSKSGVAAQQGEEAMRGVRFAAEEANAAGGVDGRKVEIAEGDDEGTPDAGRRVAEKLARDGHNLLIGPILSSISLAIAQNLDRW